MEENREKKTTQQTHNNDTKLSGKRYLYSVLIYS